jgi:hypothetical protein
LEELLYHLNFWQKLDGTRGNDIQSGSKVSITAVNGNGTELDDFIYRDYENETNLWSG